MRRKHTSSADESAEVDITPLLDIVFILLIFFIVTSTFLNEHGLTLKTPNDTPPDKNTVPPPTLTLAVQADGFVRVNNVRLIDPRSVKPTIEEFKARKPRGVVLVNAAPDSKTSVTVTVVDQAREAGTDPAVALQKSSP